ncbi:MAG TPA: alkaline phosphatase family protein, partial [Vicinamibacterales bacterium]|nr:alkaline phosphatase family protein [Vicinamibacterales bacterium]
MSESAAFRRLGVLAVAVLATGVVLGATRQSGPPVTRPKLVVMLVVDQFRTDYVERYGHEWTGGLRRILDRGAWFSQAAYPHYNTVTCVGHATIGTGTFPSTHGMILNEWWVREAGRREACTADESTTLVGHGFEATGRGESARKLRATTLAEEMHAQLDHSMRVMSFSLKARSAIGLAGRRGDAVVWWDGRDFVTSSAFADGPIPAVKQFVEHHPIAADAGRTWERTLPVDRYLFESPAVGAKPSSSMTPEFPHALAAAGSRAFSGQWQRSPFADAYLARMALHTARALGAGS